MSCSLSNCLVAVAVGGISFCFAYLWHILCRKPDFTYTVGSIIVKDPCNFKRLWEEEVCVWIYWTCGPVFLLNSVSTLRYTDNVKYYPTSDSRCYSVMCVNLISMKQQQFELWFWFLVYPPSLHPLYFICNSWVNDLTLYGTLSFIRDAKEHQQQLLSQKCVIHSKQ